uniref:RRM domain-containing protein n=1 Tax=Mesocestoides corti TaxID=53468 RepID=A0A5K3FJB9_MESCO
MTEYKASDLVEMARSRMDELNSRTLLLGHLPRNTTLKKLITVFKDSINARFPRKKFKGNRKFVNFACQINIFAHFVKVKHCFNALILDHYTKH